MSPNPPPAPLLQLAPRERIHPRAIDGLYARWRIALVWITQLFFYGVPWLQWNGRQALLFDLEAGRYHVFGLLLYPQDFFYLTALLVLCALGLFFVTAVAGRIWCGYACPQTVYTEIFLWIEHRFEGDRSARLRLDNSGWGLDKLGRRGGKHAAWLGFSLWTGFTFVGYFTPIRELALHSLSGAMGPWELFWVMFYGTATYGNAGFLREQMCTYICPYARFQSALIDRDSLIIGYDVARGEPRGARPKTADAAALGLGDCIDCTLCVQVCPTGIDIRNGLQNACIGCAACIDACDSVMDRIGAPRGLIRYATEAGLEGHWSRSQMIRRLLRPRVLIYAALMAVLVGVFAWSLSHRPPLRLDVVRDRAALARWDEQGRLENVYRLQVSNQTEQAQRLTLSVDGLPGLVVSTLPATALPPSGIVNHTVQVALPMEAAQQLTPGSHPITLRLQAGEGAPAEAATTFYVPR
ncbi:cytochrome c oxidase accessory protein CcoG [Ideonella sp. 4Y16]|uniref:Cytochrome c oxidase accessory protein CcoG n=1 Tax=Ideonella alba TaxID=2824118 RepID=A0A940YHK5_9BURK|nr:cytochrome c oxidase accessory protein CcoG [Ideonella alba]MBQ0933521.1 cytochrome c oxidase accessory protein CcoG [Ideonella alba]MBQ0946501.1 cytochrome c oxidase accessory protein CcoG [Ideonella alba]